MSSEIDTQSWAQLVEQIKVLEGIERKEALAEFEEIYGRTKADRMRKEVETQIALAAGTIVGWEEGSFTNISDQKIDMWHRAYPMVNIKAELAKAQTYLVTNPGHVKSKYERYLTNWFSREMTKAVKHKRSTGRVTATQLHQAFQEQHEATRICAAADLIAHLQRSPLGAKYVVDWLFDEQFRQYGNQFSSKWVGCDVQQLKNQWAADIGQLTPEELRTGIRRMKKECGFPPNWPEFMKLCRPGESLETLFMTAATLSARYIHDHTTAWPDAVLYYTAQRFGMGELAQTIWLAGKSKFTQIYHDVLTQKEDGTLPPLPAAVPRLDAPAGKTRSAAGSQALAEARALLKRGSGGSMRPEAAM